MKRTLLVLTLIAINVYVIAQNLSLSNWAGSISNGTSIDVVGDSGSTLEAHVYITNNSSSGIHVKVRKVEESIIPFSENYFCWGTCYSPVVFTSPDSILIDGGATNTTDFIGEYYPAGQVGISVIRYVFFDAQNPDDTVSVTVNYNATPVGINETDLQKTVFSNAYPNPATTSTSIAYVLPQKLTNAQIIVRDLLGNTLIEKQLLIKEGKVTLNISDLPDGIYFYSLLMNNQIYKSRKLIIRN